MLITICQDKVFEDIRLANIVCKQVCCFISLLNSNSFSFSQIIVTITRRQIYTNSPRAELTRESRNFRFGSW